MYLADMLSRASLPLTKADTTMTEGKIFHISEEHALYKEIASINQAEYPRVSDNRLAQIQRMTREDPTLQVLKQVVLAGWPETKEECPILVQAYWTFRDELPAQNGILYKGCRVIIPDSMRHKMITRIHASHQGIENSLRRAREVLYWPNMSKEVGEAIA